MHFDALQIIQVVMDAPALCRFVGLMGAAASRCCPACCFESRVATTREMAPHVSSNASKRKASPLLARAVSKRRTIQPEIPLLKVTTKQVFGTPAFVPSTLVPLKRTDTIWRQGLVKVNECLAEFSLTPETFLFSSTRLPSSGFKCHAK